MKFRRPAIEHTLVVRQEPPQVSFDHGAAVLFGSERHRQREWVGIARVAPIIVVNKSQSAAVLVDATDLPPVQKSNKLVGHDLILLAFVTISSMSPVPWC